MSRLAVLRRPLIASALEPDLGEHAHRNRGPSGNPPSRPEARKVDVRRQDPDQGAGSERSGRHRTVEVAVREAISDHDRPRSDDVATAAGVTDRHGGDSSRVGRAVTGGWVPIPTEGSPDGDFAASSDRDEDDRDEDDRDEDESDDGEGDGDPGADQESIAGDPGRAVRARRVGRHWGRFAELWIPEPLRDARVDPGRRGAIVLLLVATLAAIVTAIGVWRDRPEPRPVESSTLAALAVSAGPSTADPVPSSPVDGTTAPSGQPGAAGQDVAAAPVPSAEIVVSVTGLVGKPGIVTLPAGARVADAIAAAGGVAEGGDLTGLNLAARLADGDSVVVGNSANAGDSQSGVSGDQQGQSAAAASGAPNGDLVNLNTADEAALDTLPGVGPVMAKNILAWREANGKFTTVEQLQEITGIGPSRYAQLSPLVTVS
jgi:competence protein ComEA